MFHPRGRISPRLPASAPRRDRFVRAVFRLVQGLQLHGVFRAAPAMAFHFFLSLLPLLAFVGYVLGLIARRSSVAAIVSIVLENAPATAQTVLKDEVSRLGAADRLGPLAAVGFLWVASGGMHGLMNAVEAVVGARRRPWWKKRVLALGWVVAVLAAFSVATLGIVEWDEVVHPKGTSLVTTDSTQPTDDPTKSTRVTGAQGHGSSRAQRAAGQSPSQPQQAQPKRVRRILRSGGERLLFFSLTILGALGGLCAFYRLAVSHAQSIRRRVLPGAAAAVLSWILISWGFSLYLRTLASYTVYYGGLAAVAVLLVWLWLVSLAILVGAELNSQLEGLRDELPNDTY